MSLEGHAVGAGPVGAFTAEKAGFRQWDGEQGADCKRGDACADILWMPAVVAREESAEQLVLFSSRLPWVKGLTYHDYEDELGVNPGNVHRQDAESQLEVHPYAQPDTCSDLLTPPVRPLWRNVQLDLAADNALVYILRIRVDQINCRTSEACSSRLWCDYVQKEYTCNHDDINIEAPGWIYTVDQYRTNHEPDGYAGQKGPGPNAQPKSHSPAMSSSVIYKDQLFMGICGLKRCAK